LSVLYGVLKCRITVGGLAKVAIFPTNVDAENQCLINNKTFCGALNRHFYQTAVMLSLFFFCRGLIVDCLLSWCVSLVALLDFLTFNCVLAKNANVLPNALAILNIFRLLHKCC